MCEQPLELEPGPLFTELHWEIGHRWTLNPRRDGEMSAITEEAIYSSETAEEPPEKKKIDTISFKHPLLPSEEKLLENIRADQVSCFAEARPRAKDESAAIITGQNQSQAR